MYGQVYLAHKSPALNGSSVLQGFEHGNMTEIRNGLLFVFYPGLQNDRENCISQNVSLTRKSLSYATWQFPNKSLSPQLYHSKVSPSSKSYLSVASSEPLLAIQRQQLTFPILKSFSATHAVLHVAMAS